MAWEPIAIYSRTIDPAGVAHLLRESHPQATFDGPDDSWTAATVAFGKGRTGLSLTFRHTPADYAGPSWAQRLSAMKGDFSRFAASPEQERAMLLISTFRFSLGALTNSGLAEGDPRLDVIAEVAQHLDGVLFTPSALRDPWGRVLFGRKPADPDAIWPKVRGEVDVDSGAGRAMHAASRPKSAANDSPSPETPDAARVARRALALTAVTVRAILEQEATKSHAPGLFDSLHVWAAGLGLFDELEPAERAAVDAPLGKMDRRLQVNSTWRLEALTVLAWALGRIEMPPHDALVEFNPMWGSLGFLDRDAARELFAAPKLRPRAELLALRNRLFAVHWRMRNFHLKPKAMDFAKFARTCWFGPLDISGLPLVEADLSVGALRIDKADPRAVAAAHSAAQERHQAANWLLDGPATFSDASVAT